MKQAKQQVKQAKRKGKPRTRMVEYCLPPEKKALALAAFLRAALVGAPLPEPDDPLNFPIIENDPLRVLVDFNTEPLFATRSMETLLCYGLFALVTTAEARSGWHLQVAGGEEHRLRLSKADLTQEPLPAGPLPLNSRALYQRLVSEFPVFVRLMRAARHALASRSLFWKAYFEAAVIVLLRILRACQALLSGSTIWYTLVCIKRALRDTWKALFGAGADLPDILQDHIGPVEVTRKREREVLIVLVHEQRQKIAWLEERGLWRGQTPSLSPPEPFAELVARWQAEGIPEILTSGQMSKEQEAEVCGWV